MTCDLGQFFEIFLETLSLFKNLVLQSHCPEIRAHVWCIESLLSKSVRLKNVWALRACAGQTGAVSAHYYLLLCSRDVFWSLIVSLVCWLSIGMCCAQSHKPTTLMQKTRTNVTFTQSSRQATFTQQSIATFCTHTNQHQCKTNKQTNNNNNNKTNLYTVKQTKHSIFFIFF